MVITTGRRAFDRDGRWTDDAPGPDAAAAVDSWLVDDGSVRGLERHEARFVRCCRTLLPGGNATRQSSFLAAVRTAVPAGGRWFPRIEAHSDPEKYVLWMRTAPPTEDTVALWTSGEPDPREHPGLKGPDLHMLSSLRGEARAQGCDDALLLTPDGVLVEAAHSALVWWRGADLCLPPSDLARLPSVTSGILVDLVRRDHRRVREERCRPEDLHEAEPWALNALHGIRPVRWLCGRPSPSPRPGRLSHWRTALDLAVVDHRDGAGVP